MRYVDIDASGRSRRATAIPRHPPRSVPVDRIDAGAIDRIVTAASGETSAPVEGLTLSGHARVERADDGRRAGPVRRQPRRRRSAAAGRGRTRSRSAPAPTRCCAPENLKRVLDAARAATSGKARVSALDVPPGQRRAHDRERRRASPDAATTATTPSSPRATSARAPARPRRPIALDDIDPARSRAVAQGRHGARARRASRDVQYVLLSDRARRRPPGLLLYLPPGSDPPYVVGDLHGRRLSWPGRELTQPPQSRARRRSRRRAAASPRSGSARPASRRAPAWPRCGATRRRRRARSRPPAAARGDPRRPASSASRGTRRGTRRGSGCPCGS